MEVPKPSTLKIETERDLLSGRNYVTLGRFCDLLGVTYQTGLRYVKRDYVKAVRVGGFWRIYEDELRRFLESGNAGMQDQSSQKAVDHMNKTGNRRKLMNWSTDELE